MNIFVLDSVPSVAAKYHCDRHVIKMILESAQLLSTAHRLLDGEQGIHPDPEWNNLLYATTHNNHPCAIWVRQSSQNYQWVYQLMLELNAEFVRRYNKDKNHATIDKLSSILESTPQKIPGEDFTLPPCCMPESLRQPDVVEAYRNYYRVEKRSIANWTNTPVPYWYS